MDTSSPHKIESVESQILKDKLDVLAGNYNSIAYANIVVSIFTIYVMFDVIEHFKLYSWCGFIVLWTFIRVIVRNHYTSKKIFSSKEVDSWSLIFTILTLVAGLTWGYGGWFFIIESEPHLITFIAVTWIGMSAGSIGSNGVHFPGFLAFAMPIMLALSARIMSIGEQSYIILGFFAFSLTVGFLGFAYANHKSVLESLRLRYQNIDLLNLLEEKNDALNEQIENVKNANQQKSKFLAAASHDLRQPLQSLTLFSEVLQYNELDESSERTLGKMTQSISALNSLFNRLLDISRLDAGDIKPIIQPIPFKLIIEKLNRNFATQCATNNIKLVIQDTELVVQSDPELLLRCFSNLINNAVLHSQCELISVNVVKNNNNAVVTISDNGCGIPITDKESVFEEFHQLNNPERDRNKGLGLGLAIVKRMFTLLNHPLSLDSEPNKGTTFTVQLPISITHTTPITSGSRRQLHDFNNEKVLVIDDEMDIREAMENLLRKWNLHVVSIADKQELLKLLDTDYTPDIIVSDYRLPKSVTGGELIELFRETRQIKIPAMLITGDTDPKRIAEARETGLLLMHKPIQPAKLRLALTQTLQSYPN
ncbi:hybrid sensor histidine kinase/response regulator [Parashewanella spongiae]|uniref:histidine kinase n=1 Tax=Parashewanella spongiae TaxID=342950 RepID=A0A3A6TFW9_9GAMM|nr:hybrid sensor histidine kinase/response regulator [Parashewanella spongiae]MCL1079621.1 hybrid sensor histidine kinase/response regulator [Parashewanella spongiae]RJY07197.1 hybrid sensor histidine kinase/response regulator [Parashewanella spongiae]